MAIYGYARVSTGEQNYALQLDALQGFGVEGKNILTEQISGAIDPMKREGLSALLKKLAAGDVLVVWKLDRLGRSALDMLNLDKLFREREIKLISLTEGVDTKTPTGQFYYALLASVAEMERATIQQRVVAGLKAAKLRGKVLGRPRKLRPELIRQIHILKCAGESINDIARNLNIGRTTVYRALNLDLAPEVNPELP